MVQPKYNPQEALERVKLMMNYDLSKTSTENKKVIEEQTEEKSRFSCIINYYKSRNVPYEEYSMDGYEAVGVTLSPKLNWDFSYSESQGQQWLELKRGDNLKKKGIWNCSGGSNFTIRDINSNKIILDTTQPVETPPKQTVQPVAQPAQTQPKVDKKQDTPDPSKPQKLRPNDDPLRTTLKDSSIPKRTCIAFIDTYHKLWTQCKEPKDAGPECKNEAQIIERRGYVQRCMNQHFPSPKKIGQGQWGITGLVTKDTDRKLLELSACQTPAPSQSGPDSIFRLTRKC
jgi:hypothetical protein